MKSRRRIAFLKGSGPRQLHRLLHQGFTTGEMGFRGQFARHKSFVVHVRFGSKADVGAATIHVRFAPESGHSLAR
jgi:hypothetical protein